MQEVIFVCVSNNLIALKWDCSDRCSLKSTMRDRAEMNLPQKAVDFNHINYKG